MSKRKRFTFTEEQKGAPANLIRTSGEPVSRIASNLGIHANTLHGRAFQTTSLAKECR